MTAPLETSPIDAVITWVDGNDPAHLSLRRQYMTQEGRELSENARNPHRWEQSDEIYFCLNSIQNHAPWVRYIWIVVADSGPDLSRLVPALQERIKIITHAEIFAGFDDVLPTFNSLAIESMMWRIEGLSERFLYFNDDVFLTSPLEPTDVFEGPKPVLRGEYRDYSEIAQDIEAVDDPALFNHFMQINAAALCGVPATQIFAAAHVVHSMRRSVMSGLFTLQRAAFEKNISYRFRDISQFLPQGLHNQTCIAAGEVSFAQASEHLHIKSGQGAGGDPKEVRDLLLIEGLKGVKFLCINDLPQLEVLVSDARALMEQAVGGMP